MYLNVLSPPVWDFRPFWINGRVAAEQLNFYDSESYYQVAFTYFQPESDFVEEILDPAFFYPPPAMFLFNPLGWFDVSQAAILWYIVQGLATLASMYLLWKTFLPESGYWGFILVSTLTLWLYPTRLTFGVAQLNMLTLLMALLFLKEKYPYRSGLWIVLGTVFKPLMAILGVFALFKRSWKVILAAVGIALAISLVTIIVYGLDNVLPYITDNPTAKLPDKLYWENGFASLAAVTVRVLNFDVSSGSILLQPTFLSAAFALTLPTLYVTFKIKDPTANPLLLSWSLVLALLIYPHTQIYYCVLLLVPILVIWQDKSIRPVGVRIGLAAILFAVLDLKSGDYTFLALLLCWIVCFYLAVQKLRSGTRLEHLPQG